METENIITLISALGGWEAIKWLIHFLTHRKTDVRREEASLADLTAENHRKQVDWLEERLAQRDTTIDSLQNELRKEQADKLEWINHCHETELTLKELEIKQCVIHGCAHRTPVSDY